MTHKHPDKLARRVRRLEDRHRRDLVALKHEMLDAISFSARVHRQVEHGIEPRRLSIVEREAAR
jgi:hypothetical protein